VAAAAAAATDGQGRVAMLALIVQGRCVWVVVVVVLHTQFWPCTVLYSCATH
jgi:hypothetical protein